jgi:hypothetical protein
MSEDTEIFFTQAELEKVMVKNANGTYSFIKRKHGYANLIRAKIEAVTKKRDCKIVEPLKLSGSGDNETKRMYWTCAHGRQKGSRRERRASF